MLGRTSISRADSNHQWTLARPNADAVRVTKTVTWTRTNAPRAAMNHAPRHSGARRRLEQRVHPRNHRDAGTVQLGRRDAACSTHQVVHRFTFRSGVTSNPTGSGWRLTAGNRQLVADCGPLPAGFYWPRLGVRDATQPPSSMTDTSAPPHVRPVVLAGGTSTRFADGNKAFATLGGTPLLERVLDTVSGTSAAVPVVAVQTRRQRQRIEAEVLAERPHEATFVFDDSDFEGPLAGLYAACSSLNAPWLFLVGCDMPLVDPDAVTWLRNQLQTSTADAVVPETDRGVEPLHALYRRDSVEAVRGRLQADDGLHVLLDVLDETTVVPVEDCPSDLDRSTRNVNTVVDLRALERQQHDASE